MKNIIIIAASLLSAIVFAQSPEKMSYQAVVRDASDDLVIDTNVGIQISILQGSADGTALYIEKHFPTTNTNGLVTVEIGMGTVVSGNFSFINWADGPYFLKTETDLNGGANYTITGTSQLLSVPYALYAKDAENITGTITESQISDIKTYLTSETDPAFISSQAANITDSDIADLRNLSGINTGDQDLSILATITSLGDSTSLVRSEIPDVSGFINAETDPVFNTWDKTTGITILSSQISDFQTSVTNNSEVVANTAKNNYPTSDSTKLASIASGAEVNVNANWNTLSGDSQILNKPTTIDGYNIVDAVNTTSDQTIDGNKTFTGTIDGSSLLLSGSLDINGNVIIGTAIKEPSAVLNVSSTSQGLLPPRMTYEQKLAIVSPVSGLLIWCSDCGAFGEIQVYNGTTWTNLIGGVASESLPIMDSTTPVSSISETTAVSGGNVINDGGGTITARGVCWSTSINPTIVDNITLDGTGTGEFISSLTGLTGNTTYYVRSYATNSIGTAYGSEISFYLLPSVEINGTLFVHPTNNGARPWGAWELVVGAYSATNGEANTQLIVQTLGPGFYAAYLCDTLTAYGYDDWYLPARDELAEVYYNRDEIGGFGTTSYWTSTEINYQLANDIKFNSTITVYTYWKNDSGIGVRCVRRDD